jgi:hypothetical protein
VQPEAAARLLDLVTRYGQASGVDNIPAVDRPGQLAVAGLLSGADHFGEAFEISESEDDALFPSMDASRALLLAVSTRGNEELMAHLRHGVPPRRAKSFLFGLSARLFVPASDEDRLRRELEQFCARDETPCQEVRRFDTSPDYAVVDIHWDPLQGLRKEWAPETMRTTWDDVDANYWRRDTPALRAFVAPDAAASLYMRADDFWMLGAYVGVLEAHAALQRATPEHRARLLTRGYEVAGSLFTGRSPEARTYEDAALRMSPSGEDGVVLESFRTRTKLGAKIAQAAQTTFDMPAIGVLSPLIEFEWVRDNAAAIAAAKVPAWMEALSGQGGANRLLEKTRTSGLWGSLPLLNYPDGFARGLNMLLDPSHSLSAWPLGFQDVFAIHLGFDWVADAISSGSSRAIGGAPRGAVILALAKDSKLDQLIRTYATQIGQMLQVKTSVDTETRQNKKIVRVLVGDSTGLIGKLTPVKQTLKMRLDLNMLADRLDVMFAGQVPMQRAVLATLRRAQTATMVGTGTDEVSGLRIYAGPHEPEPQEIPQSSQGLIQPKPAPNCLKEASAASRKVEVLTDPSGFNELVEKTLKTLEAFKETCKEHPSAVADIEWMQAKWIGYAGHRLASQAHWSRAQKMLAVACRRGDEQSCVEADALSAFQEHLRLPAVTVADVVLDRATSDRLLVTREGVESPMWETLLPKYQDNTLSLVQVQQMAAGDSSEHREFLDNLSVHPQEVGTHGLVNLTVLFVDRTVSSEVAASLVKLASQKDMSKRKRQARLTNELIGQGGLVAAFTVETPAQDKRPAVLLFRGLGEPADPDAAQIELALGQNGISIVRENQKLAPIEGCPADGPTLCVQDAAAVSALLERVLAGDLDKEAETDALDTLTEMYRIPKLPSRLDTTKVGETAPRFILRADKPIPFGLLADLHAALTDWTRQNYGDQAVPEVVLLGQERSDPETQR